MLFLKLYIGAWLVERDFLEKLIGKKIRIIQKDNFTKIGICRGYDERFLFLEFNDGSDVAVSLDNIIEIKILEGRE